MSVVRNAAVGAVVLSLLVVVLFKIGNCPPIPSVPCSLLGVGCRKGELYVAGEVKEGWEGVVEKIRKVARDGYELGGTMSVFHKGERVIDVVFGWQDRTFEEKYTNDTLQIIFSSTKVVESIAMAMLVDRGLINYEDRIAKYWPEFAQAGKEDVTIGDLMSHAGGVAGGFTTLLGPEELRNDREEKTSSRLSSILAETPLDESCFRQKGTQGYHAISRGLFSSQILRRVDPQGRNLDEFVRDEIISPMGLDFRIGLVREEEVERNGEVVETPWWRGMFGLMPRFFLPKWMTGPFFDDISLTDDEMRMMKSVSDKTKAGSRAIHGVFKGQFSLGQWGRDPDWRHIESPSTHGFSNGQTLGRIAQAMNNKGTDPWTGTKLMSQKTWEKATKLFPPARDSVLSIDTQYSQGGFGSLKDTGDCLGWGGAGGSFLHWCPNEDLAIGYVMNYYSPHGMDWRGIQYLLEAVEIAKNKQ